MNWTVFAVCTVILVILGLSAIWLLSRYRRYFNDQILVVFGSSKENKPEVDMPEVK